MAAPEIRVGTSGWNYWHWKGVFYPEELPRADWLAHYQSEFDTVELNASFYRLVRASTYQRWQQASPPGFLWTVKANRQITHLTRLAKREPVEEFLATTEGLGASLGVILFQLPPSLKFAGNVAERFLGWLPAGRRYALEPRHASWFEPEAVNLLKRHGIAVCAADSGGRFPSGEHLTADFVYVRFHGGERLYASRYSTEQMRAWAEKLLAWNRPAFVYFNNDFHGYAVENARELKRELARVEPSQRPAARRASAGAR